MSSSRPRRSLAMAAVGIALVAAAGGQAFAESAGDAGPTAASKCLKAEVNPVTGHVLCIDPIGAPVEPPPAAEIPCKPDQRTNEASALLP